MLFFLIFSAGNKKVSDKKEKGKHVNILYLSMLIYFSNLSAIWVLGFFFCSEHVTGQIWLWLETFLSDQLLVHVPKSLLP